MTGTQSISRICFITETEGFGGTEVHTIQLVRALIQRGHFVDIIACNLDPYSDRLQAEVNAGAARIQRVPHTTLAVSRSQLAPWRPVFEKLEAPVLIIPKGSWQNCSLRFIKLCRRKFRRIYFIEHLEAEALPRLPAGRLFGVIPLGLGLWRYRRLWDRHRAASRADKIIAVSAAVRARLIRDWRIPGNWIEVVRNGVRASDFRRDAGAGEAFRAELGIPQGAFVFGMLTRLTSLKAVDVAVRAAGLLAGAGTGKEFHLIIAGKGEDEATLRQLTRELGLADVIKFAGHRDDVRPMISAFNAIVFSSRKEGLPLGLLEAMAAECIPIVTRISGMPEVVDIAGCGSVVDVDSPEMLAHGMEQALTMTPAEIAEAGLKARRAVETSFDLRRCHDQIIAICGL